jgi:exonuclease III
MSFINAYAPHSWLTGRGSTEVDMFYQQLSETVEKYTSSTAMCFLLGDFNAKVGHSAGDMESTILGSYGIGRRNHHGELFTDFLFSHHLFAANTAFKKQMKYLTTWHGSIRGKVVRNMIDYIVIPSRFKSMLRDCAAHYDPNLSDHSMVVAEVDLQRFYVVTNLRSREQKSLGSRRALDRLRVGGEDRDNYQTRELWEEMGGSYILVYISMYLYRYEN